jgi:large subunit ribosomal protein L25
MANTVLEATGREAADKNAAKRLRRTGMIPAVLYGAGKPSVPVTVDPKKVNRILHSDAGHNTIFDLSLEGEQTKAMIVDWQHEPIKGGLMHIDLLRIAMDKKLRVKVPIDLKGEPVGVKQQGGMLEHTLREVEIECLPGDIPGHIDLDVSQLGFGAVLRVSDLAHDDKLTFLTDGDIVVAHVVAMKEHSAVVATPEAGAAPAEPEVAKKGKVEPAAADAKKADDKKK